MTAGRPPPQSPTSEGRQHRPGRISRRVSSLSLADDTVVGGDSSSSKKKSAASKASASSKARISRQVSQVYLVSSVSDNEGNEKENPRAGGRSSPVRCVSEFDKVTGEAAAAAAAGQHHGRTRASTSMDALPTPPFMNPLHDPKLLEQHTKALRLEADLHPMRLILSRLMAHTTLNRKAVFNTPVDPVALGLPDYFDVVERPMDLGTIKVRLHAVAFRSRREVADDIRLVFANSMRYNPPHNAVHAAAKDLLAFFEDQVQAFVPDLVLGPAANNKKPVAVSELKCPPPQPAAAAAAAATAAIPSQGTVTEGGTTAATSTSITSSTSAAESAVGGKQASTDTALGATSFKAAVEGQPAGTLSSSITNNVHTTAQTSTRKSASAAEQLARQGPVVAVRKRKKRGSRVDHGHVCDRCEGRCCTICKQGCLALEPTLLICNGAACAGARIRKGALYFIAKDGARQFCERCITSLPAVLPVSGQGDVVRYKRDLLKRKNDEEVVERWVSCAQCETAVHEMCAIHDPFAHSEAEYRCPCCVAKASRPQAASLESTAAADDDPDELYTFVCGSELPVRMSEVSEAPSRLEEGGLLSSEALPETELSSFIQSKIRERMKSQSSDYPNADRTVHVRIISDCSRYFVVPEVVRKHFRVAALEDSERSGVVPPTKVLYRSKAISLFQKVDGLDVCIFCMYVQEYDGKDEYEAVAADPTTTAATAEQKKRVYIAYLDSVEHFRPRVCRTSVYQEMLVAYLATARKRGYETAHIWACPPSRGNSFVFWNHPASQRTPSRERLVAWYHGALSRAVDCGVVADVQSLYESDFQGQFEEVGGGGSTFSLESRDGHIFCPPLLDGDFWIEEALRIHSVNMTRYVKAKAGDFDASGMDSLPSDGLNDPCPARQVAALLRDRVLSHESSLPFRRPVNAAAMKLQDYHTIITSPMDLGTVFCRCILGEYAALSDLVSDVELVFSNAQRYNPEGHVVHTMADDVRKLFFHELNTLVRSWKGSGSEDDGQVSWESYGDTSMNLDAVLDGADAEQKERDTAATEPSPAPEVAEGGEATSSKEAAEASAPDAMDVDLSASAAASQAEDEESKLSTSTTDLLGGGPEAVSQRMVGEDTWLLEKNTAAPKGSVSVKGKKGVGRGRGRGRRRKSYSEGEDEDEPAPKRRRQSWLGTEVGAAVRRMRTSFFSCSLVVNPDASPDEEDKALQFEKYAEDYPASVESCTRTSSIADARHALLEFSQYRNLEFDTLRRAKYSTAVLLYHLHNDGAPGTIPACSACHQDIKEVRWHKVGKIVQRRHKGAQAPAKPPANEELCSDCFSKLPKTDAFIPLQVTLTHSTHPTQS